MTDTSACPRCSSQVDANASWCYRCGTRFQSATTTADSAARPDSSPAANASDAGERGRADTCPNESCNAQIPAGYDHCPYCGRSISRPAQADQAHLELSTPWGTIPLKEGDSLPLGRLPSYSPYARPLAGYTSVSRRHAIITCTDGRAELSDEGSRNGTYHNGHRLITGKGVGLKEGDRISLARQVEITIQHPEQQ